MSAYDGVFYERVVDRSGTEATKWERYGADPTAPDGLIPLWLADMDIAASDEIVAALRKRAEHPIYGYTDRGPQYQQLFASRYKDGHANPAGENIVLSTGVMYSIAGALQVFTRPGEGVLILRPCYAPFTTTVERLGRRPVYVDLMITDGGYKIDMAAFEAACQRCSAFLLCNPHNPTGRVFSRGELEALAQICERHSLMIISDEIHCDFVYGDSDPFVSISSVSPYARNHSVCCVAPTKSFNLAGLKVSAAIIHNPRMLQRFRTYAQVVGINSINLFAMEALKAAYLRSDEWQKGLLEHLAGNRQIVADFVVSSSGGIQGHKPEGTYFYWMRLPGIAHASSALRQEAGVVVSGGEEFDPGLDEWIRLNFACPRAILSGALARIRQWGEGL